MCSSDIRYISQREARQTKDDIYTIYSTPSAEAACLLMDKYGFTHVFITDSFDKAGNFGSKFHNGFGATINRDKFKDSNFFNIIYSNKGVMIVELKRKTTT